MGTGLRPAQPVAADAISTGFIDQHIGFVGAKGDAVGELQLVEQDAGLAALKVVTQQTAVGAVLDDRLTVMAIAPAARGIAEVGVVA